MRLVRLAGFPGSGWFFGFQVLGGVAMIVAAVGGYFTPPLEISGSFCCLASTFCCTTSDGARPLWTPVLLTLLLSGVSLLALGAAGLILRFAGRRAGRIAQAEGSWASFIGGSSGWCLAVTLWMLTVVHGPGLPTSIRNGLPYGTYLPLTWGAIVLFALTAFVWGRGLYRGTLHRTRRSPGAVQGSG